MDTIKVSLYVAVLLAISIPCCLTKKGEFHKRPRGTPVAAKIKISGLGQTKNVGDDVCAEICSGDECRVYYCKGDYICCTHGDPESLCCPADHPVCLPEGCCETGYTKICGDHCCTSDSACCKTVDNCCESEEECCNSEECCEEESPCCRAEGDSDGACCSKETMACCDGQCGSPCPSQFDVVPCDEEKNENTTIFSEQVDVVDCPNRLQTGVLYRSIRSDENCYGGGLFAKDPTADKTVLSHVNCGSKTFMNYKSQYISFSTSLDVLVNKYLKPGGRIVEVKLENIPEDCKTYDLTLPMNRAKWLGKAVLANRCAAADCEVLLWCESRIPCKTIKKGYEGDRVEL